MNSSKKTTVLLFLKAPRPGLVKTRLARSLGNEKACDIYRLLVKQTLSQIPENWTLRVHFAPIDAEEEMRAWLGPRPELLPQPDGDLGHRLKTACKEAFTSTDTDSVILLGGDCPALTTQHLEACAKHLADSVPVLGPAEDGGYWLLGIHKYLPELFEDIPWSTSEVLSLTRERFSALELTPILLETLSDVDELETWEQQQRFLNV